jgi:tRNA (guanine-N7-)-methyltransferase
MARKKLERFAHITQSERVLEQGKELYDQIKGQWNEKMFQRQAPLVLELACGRAEYSVGLAQVYPEKNFVGIDIKGERMYKGLTQAQEKGLSHVAFLRTHIQNLDAFFDLGEVSEIWIVHPDPRPKTSDMRRRLTNPRFLAMYRRLLKEKGWVRLKTDSTELFDYTLNVLAQQPIENLIYTHDLDNSPLLEEHFGITTRYEMIFKEKGAKIHYLKFQFLSLDSPSS